MTVTGLATLAGRSLERVAFGAARLTAGDGWGVPAEPERSRALLRSAIEAGYRYIDTADALGPGVSEQIIGETVTDQDDVLVATKVGMLRPSGDRWQPLGHPDYLRQQVHLSLQRLRRERIELLYLHRIDPAYPLADQLGALQELRDQGLIGAIGISEPTPEQFEEAVRLEPALAAVQSLYNVVATGNQGLAERAAELGIAFVAYWPLVGRGLEPEVKQRLFAALDAIALPLGLNAAQLSLAYIFGRLPGSFAVAGSRSSEHLRENAAAGAVQLDEATLSSIEQAVRDSIGDTPFNPRYPEGE